MERMNEKLKANKQKPKATLVKYVPKKGQQQKKKAHVVAKPQQQKKKVHAQQKNQQKKPQGSPVGSVVKHMPKKMAPVLLPTIPPAIIVSPAIALGSADSALDFFAENFLSTLTKINPTAGQEMAAGGLGLPGRVKFYIMWAILSKLREAGSLTSANGDVFTMFPEFPSDGPVPVSAALFLKYMLPYEHNGTRFNKNFTMDATYFGTTTNNGIIQPSNTGVSKSITGNVFSVYGGTAADYNLSGAASYVVADQYQKWQEMAAYLSGSVSCVSYSKIGSRAPDASAHALLNAGQTRCAVPNYNKEYVGLFNFDLAVNAVADPGLNMHAVEQVVVQGATLPMNSNMQMMLKQMNFCSVFAESEFRGTIHASLMTTDFRDLATFAPTVRYLNAKAFWDVVMVSQQGYCINNSMAMASTVVWWCHLLAACRRGLAMSLCQATSTDLPLHRPFATLPVPAAVAEYISGIGPVVNEGRIHWVLPRIDAIPAPTTGRSWLRFLVSGFSGAFDDGPYVWSNSVIVSGGVVIGPITYNTTNFPAGSYTLVPVKVARDITLSYNTISPMAEFVPVEEARRGLPDVLCPVDIVYSTSTAGAQNGISIASSARVDSIVTPVMGSGVDLHRFLAHSYIRASSESVDLYPRGSRTAGLIDPSFTFYRWITTQGFTRLNEEIAGLAVKSEDGKTIGSYTTESTAQRSGVVNAIRKVANDYFSTSEKAGGTVDVTPKEIASANKDTSESYDWAPYLWAAGKFAVKHGVPYVAAQLSRYGAQNTNQAALGYDVRYTVEEV